MTALDDQIVIALRDSAQALATQTLDDLDVVLSAIVAAAARTVPGTCGGGLSRVGAGHLRAEHATDDDIGQLEALQHEVRQGPGVTVIDDPPETGMVIARDLAAPADTDRWPRFAPLAAGGGYRSALSTQLSTNSGRQRSVLTLYSRTPHAFTGRACVIAGLFAAQASLLLTGAERVANYERALDTRDVIGRAKGILIERLKIDDEQAFRKLVTSSQETNLKLVDVARWLSQEAGAGGRSASAAEGEADPAGLRVTG